VGGLPVAYAEYRLGEGAWTRGATAIVPASSDHSSDGIQTVGYRSADTAMPANVEGVKSCTVKIDTTGPTAMPLAKVTVKKGKTATFRYRVNDALPSGMALSPTATVKIVVQSSKSKMVKRLTLGSRATNTPLSYSWACSLKKGSYRFLIYAVDEAGNAQTKVGIGKLAVT